MTEDQHSADVRVTSFMGVPPGEMDSTTRYFMGTTGVWGIPRWMNSQRAVYIFFAGGAIAFLIGIVETFFLRVDDKAVSVAFLIANLFNLITAYYAWVLFFQISRSTVFKVYASLLFIPALMFALCSTLVFGKETFQSLGVYFLLGDTLAIKYLLFVFGLPVQIAVYFLSSLSLSLTVGNHEFSRDKVIVPRGILRAHLFFLLLSVVATATLFLFILPKQHWDL